MPCYDKKLEAVRPNLQLPLSIVEQNTQTSSQADSQIKEVDTVLATHELIDLFEKHSIDITK